MNYLSKKCLSVGLIILSSIFAGTSWSAIHVTTASAGQQCGWRLSAAQFVGLSDATITELIKGCIGRIEVTGEISKGDSKYFAEVLQVFEQEYAKFLKGRVYHRWVWPDILLNSEGGSVLEAISIAKTIRQSSYMQDSIGTFMRTDDICHSACVIILAASYKRHPYGHVGIHRPYFLDGENVEWGYSNLQEAYNVLYDELSISFKRWNISNSLIDDMFAVPSNDLRLLTEEEISAYRLNQDDMVIVEKDNALMRKICGPDSVHVERSSDRNSEYVACIAKINAYREYVPPPEIEPEDAVKRLAEFQREYDPKTWVCGYPSPYESVFENFDEHGNCKPRPL